MKRALLTLVVAPTLLSAQAPQATKPGPEHQKLAYFVGHWKETGDVKAGPMGPAGKINITSNCESFAGGFAVVCRASGSTPSGQTQGLGVLGYDPDKQRFTYYGVDNSGMAGGEAFAQVTGDTWNWEGERTMGGQAMKSKYTIKVVSPDEYTWKWEMSMGGQPFAVVAEGTDKRVK